MALAWKASGLTPTGVRISHSPQVKDNSENCYFFISFISVSWYTKVKLIVISI